MVNITTPITPKLWADMTELKLDGVQHFHELGQLGRTQAMPRAIKVFIRADFSLLTDFIPGDYDFVGIALAARPFATDEFLQAQAVILFLPTAPS